MCRHYAFDNSHSPQNSGKKHSEKTQQTYKLYNKCHFDCYISLN